MSRWMQQFQGHAFRSNWESIKSHLQTATVDDKSVITAVSELGRLKKVISYIDGILNALDPELVPLVTWDSFSQQAAQCAAEISAFNINKNIGHIQNANSYADNLLTYVRPYMAVAGRLAKGLRESALAYSSAFSEYSSSFKKSADIVFTEILDEKKQILEIKGNIDEIALSLWEVKEKLLGGDSVSGEISLLETKISDFKEKYESILSLHETIFDGDSENPSLESSVQAAVSAAEADSKKINSLSRQASDVIADLSAFHEKIFGVENENENGDRDGGLQSELDKGMLRLTEFEQQQKIRYAALNEKIESLLPGATSAGLASSCGKMKSTFEDPIRRANRIFYGAIAALVFLAALFAIDKVSFENGFSLIVSSDWRVALAGLIARAPFFAPFIWLAYYASSRRSEFQRLQQEYAHKEVVANSYESYKQQVDALGVSGNDLLRQLLEKAIDAVSYNASETLDKKHGDKMPLHSAVDKLGDIAEKLADKIQKP